MVSMQSLDILDFKGVKIDVVHTQKGKSILHQIQPR
jgi:hypothetical protein